MCRLCCCNVCNDAYQVLLLNVDIWRYWLCCHKSADLTWLMPVIPTRSQTTDHSTPSSSVLSHHLHLPPAVPEARHPHFFVQISSPSVPGYVLFLCALAVSTVVSAWRHCRQFLVYVQANHIFCLLTAPTLVLCQFSSIPRCWIFCPASCKERTFPLLPFQLSWTSTVCP